MPMKPSANRVQSMALPRASVKPQAQLDTAAEAGTYKTLAAALSAAGQVDVPRGKDRFTLAASTNEAFAQLPPEAVDLLLTPENRAKLKAILTYHVIPDNLLVADIVQMLLIADSVTDGVWSGIG